MIFHDFPLKNQLFDEHFLVINQWIPFWILMELLENCWVHQAVTFCLFGVRSQPRYLKVSTPRAWSIARVKSRVARFYARIFLCCRESKSWKSTSGDADHPIIVVIVSYQIYLPYESEPRVRVGVAPLWYAKHRGHPYDTVPPPSDSGRALLGATLQKQRLRRAEYPILPRVHYILPAGINLAEH